MSFFNPVYAIDLNIRGRFAELGIQRHFEQNSERLVWNYVMIHAHI